MNNEVLDIEQWIHDWRRVHRPHHVLRAVAIPAVLLLGAWFAALIFGG